MMPHTSRSAARAWFCRSMALTIALGAVVVLLVAARPGYAAFFVTSSLGFLIAGFLWTSGDPPRHERRDRERASVVQQAPLFALARTYRITTGR